MTETTTDYTDSFDVTIATTTVRYKILSEDISELWFVEDIYSFCMKGKLTFIDKVKLVEFGGLSGTDIVEISYGQDDNRKVISFHTHNTSYELMNSEDYKVTVSLIDLSLKQLNYHTYSLSYPIDTLYTDIVDDMLKKYVGVEEYEKFEDCKETIPYFSTDNNSPADNIKWLLKRCSGDSSGQPGYLIYKNSTDKQWNVTTLESLLSQTTKMYITDKDEMYMFEDVNSTYVNKILSHRIKGVTNKSLPILSRGYLLGYDPTTKVFHHRVYNYYNAINRYTILGKHTLFEHTQITPYLSSEAEPINTGETDLDVMDNMWYGNWIKNYCTQQLLEVNVKGHEERYAGGMIEMVWKSTDREDEKLNQSMNGRYIIKSITHHFRNDRNPKYEQAMVLIKNGFDEKQEGNFIKAEKVNI